MVQTLVHVVTEMSVPEETHKMLESFSSSLSSSLDIVIIYVTRVYNPGLLFRCKT